MDSLGISQATLIFMIANVLVSIAGFTTPAFRNWGVFNIEAILKRNEWHRMLVSGFLHGGPLHLFVNMFTLFFFGNAMEGVLGSRTFFLVYMGSLLAGNFLSLLMHSREPNYSALGASGAVSGVLFSFCLYAPFQPIYLFGILEMPAILFAIVYTLYSIFGMRTQVDNIGHDAHLGGAVGGVVLTILLVPSILSHFLGQISGLFA